MSPVFTNKWPTPRWSDTCVICGHICQKRPTYMQRDLHICKQTYTKYLFMKDLQKRPIHMKRNLQTSPIFTTKKINTKMVWHLCDMMTYMSKETYIYAKRPIKSTNLWETDKRDLYTCKETYKRALYLQPKRPTPTWSDTCVTWRHIC